MQSCFSQRRYYRRSFSHRGDRSAGQGDGKIEDQKRKAATVDVVLISNTHIFGGRATAILVCNRTSFVTSRRLSLDEMLHEALYAWGFTESFVQTDQLVLLSESKGVVQVAVSWLPACRYVPNNDDQYLRRVIGGH